ncbi:MAG TPA: hypothetical protein VGE16_17615 [Albitalea sp.]
MRTKEKIAVWGTLLVGSASAYAAEGAPGGMVLFAFGGGFAGGLIGALLACWLCKRRDPKIDVDVRQPTKAG